MKTPKTVLPNPTNWECVILCEHKNLAERMMLRSLRDSSKLSGWSQGRVFTRERGRWEVRVREDVGMKVKERNREREREKRERKRREEGEKKGETDLKGRKRDL